MNPEETHRRVEVSDLVFDLNNPRLSGYDLGADTTEAEVIRVLWDAMDVRELVLSIEASGFFPHEPVIVARENEKKRRYRREPTPRSGQIAFGS